MINVKQAKRFCKEDISKIKNYDLAIADTKQTWHCHHMTEIWWHCTSKELIENECYYNRKACELVFLTPSEHRSLHSSNMTDETKKKMSEARKGEKNPFYGKHHSDETRKKLSEANKGNQHMKGKKHSEETKNKISETLKGRTLSEETCKKVSDALKGRTISEEQRRKLSEATKRQWARKKEANKLEVKKHANHTI